uniref:KIB1-4 beta-propeller domain-containing protein n=1 Tax=Setaria viridis TaxID=4556 RepID=A0A4U6VUL6_SETVI|nr:hypothetical protein SEVIR_2G168300v2 [Setaria viridis]
MPCTRRRRVVQQAEHANGLPPSPMAVTRGRISSIIDLLPPDLMPLIERHLGFVDRLAFATACGATPRRLLKPGLPWLVIQYKAPEKAATLFSPADRCAVAVRSPGPSMHGHAVSMGSSGGWLATADARGGLHLARPVTGEQAELPAITTIPFVRPVDSDGRSFSVDRMAFMRTRVGGGPPSSTICSYDAAMLILDMHHGFPAFASAEDPVWRLASSRAGIEDAIHHAGRFYSVTYAGEVEVWERHRLVSHNDKHRQRKYLAGASDGPMAVMKESKQVEQRPYYVYGRSTTTCVFKVLVLDEALGQWQESTDIGEAALFVDENSSTCVSTREHPELRAGCVYFTKENVGLRLGWAIQLLCWPAPAWWFAPSRARRSDVKSHFGSC